MPENVITHQVALAPGALCELPVQRGLLHRGAVRLLDIGFALAGLTLFLPLFIIIPVLIKLDSPGKVFFIQLRLGLRGKLFKIIKFRTMLNDQNHNSGRWTTRDDPRITRVGKFLRKFHLDELPQLLNVIRGELSIVGPRPYTPEVFQQLCQVIPDFSFRLCFKPGLTGWAQLVGRKGDDLEHHIEMLNNDRRYLESPLTLGMYLYLVVRTIWYFMFEAIHRIIR
jgi:lipopolysaccharide/colanic/teichoic acid biosynthesis glycosyltransferase